MKTLCMASAVALISCESFVNSVANLAEKSHGATWPGAFLVVGVCASIAWIVGKLVS